MSANPVTECKQLVERGIPNEFNEADDILIGTQPARLVEWGPVSLWGHNTGTGDKKVNLRMPSLTAWLKTLDASGIPRLAPMGPFSSTERYHGGNIVLPEDFGITRTRAIAKIKLLDDLGDWWVRHGNK